MRARFFAKPSPCSANSPSHASMMESLSATLAPCATRGGATEERALFAWPMLFLRTLVDAVAILVWLAALPVMMGAVLLYVILFEEKPTEE